MEENELTLAGVDRSAKSEDFYLQNLTFLSLRGNPIQQIEKSFFYPLRQSALTMLNIQACDLNAINSDAFRHLPNIQQIDFYKNPGSIINLPK